MESWLQRGRPALFEALTAACDQIDTAAQAELQEYRAKERSLLAEIESLGARGAQIDRLEVENKALKEELQQLRARTASPALGLDAGRLQKEPQSAATPSKRQPLADVSPNKTRTLSLEGSKQKPLQPLVAADQDDRQRNWKKLTAKYAALMESREAERAALRKRKEECIRWASYADSLEKKIKKLEKKLEACKPELIRTPIATNLSATAAYSPELVGTGFAEVLSRPSPSKNFVLSKVGSAASFCGANDSREIVPVSPRRAISLPAEETLTKVTDARDLLSDSTQEETLSQGEVEVDLPQHFPEQIGPGYVCVKEEPSSDGPVFVSERLVRKRKRDEDSGRDNIPTMKSESDGSDPMFTAETYHFSPHESIDLETAALHIITPRKRRHLGPSDASDEELEEDMGGSPKLAANQRSNSKNDTRLGEEMTYSKARRGRSSLALDHGVKDLAEDGEDTPFTPETQKAALPSAAGGRLDTLLNRPTSHSKTPVNRPAKKTPRSGFFLEGIPALRVLPFAEEGAVRIFNSIETTLQQSALTPAASREREMAKATAQSRDKTSLRDRPLSMLNLDDFKINPKFNSGHDFAFSEVVRGRGEREALPGCVDPNCCGKVFRSLAQVERKMAGPSITARAEDIKLLEQYLGDDAYRLGTMSRMEKEELWIEAKTRELANKYGKHRHRYARRSSPPGFWNVDWPSTQEQHREKEEAGRIEKALVQERYRDAMRRGGRWLFRDE
ncbi:SAE2-domain-containing protein [Pleurostoma richardsiae]|uniref:SAE2-domain-containing protein n=1 Tax=Pleurostoma richardsiae TaxID=41990 RepID=A0AA38VPU5_9PEZI|nr:SAE2-domain-containing protein [Pleurostoma richardsiae]